MEGDGDEDAGYGAAQPPATPMDVDPPVPEGEPNRNETGEEWQVTSEMRADSVAAQEKLREENEGEVEEEVKPKRKSSADRKEEEKDRDTDDKREEEEEVDELEGGGVSDAAPALKKKGYTHTGWLADLNQHLRQGKTQPAMHAYMVEMEEGLLEPADKKCKVKAGSSSSLVKCLQAFVLVPHLKPSGHLSTTDEPAQPEAGPSTMPTALDFMVEFQSFHSHPMQERPTPGHDPVTNFTFNLAEHCLGGLTHLREAAWDHILALTHQLIAAHRALEYELRRSGPFSADEVEYLLQTCYPDSMLSANEEHCEGSMEGKGDA
ncbi:hypothetical protein ARMGADRAFT_1093151 [Armillaria gallica]|uniref:Uncharacterized protein n=1 Tax=Armillaria gallica TaxID=47427 RepID=A0A2H3CJP8_ARMGA|nr:hypothetical protein ARMGADRAFT_1093151 [Armillaria gallica]